MTPQDWAALILSILSIFVIFAGGIKWLVKHYLNELKPNSGSSIKDAVCRLEEDHKTLQNKVDRMYDILLTFISDKK